MNEQGLEWGLCKDLWWFFPNGIKVVSWWANIRLGLPSQSLGTVCYTTLFLRNDVNLCACCAVWLISKYRWYGKHVAFLLSLEKKKSLQVSLRKAEIKTMKNGKDVAQLKLLHTAGRSENWCDHFGNCQYLPTLKMHIYYDWAIPFLSIQ